VKRNAKNNVPATLALVRCAVYTRKSTEEGLEQDYNSLDAQRDAGENYVKSLAGEGWTVLAERYDDGGFTGGNMDRPALKRLMADIEAGKIDCVVVYKVDRLSRSQLDFAQMMQTFDKYKVSFVSVTQQFNTATSMGRLVLNVLLSFAQFEREIISERTRDKIAATRRKGKWAGGWPILGYDVDPQGYKLNVNATEAERVRAIFNLYLEHESLLPVVEELASHGWTNKRWQTRRRASAAENASPGRACTSCRLTFLRRQGALQGRGARWRARGRPRSARLQRVQAMLERNGRSGGAGAEQVRGTAQGDHPVRLLLRRDDADARDSRRRQQAKLSRRFSDNEPPRAGGSRCSTK
jgi:DNA invertase Pin-like site-specific DNA recombinase